MSPDWFTQIDFDESSYDEHFQRIHDPEAGYDYIQYLNHNLDPDTDTYNYARVDLFRASMQYTEEFLIYFLSYINTEDDFVEDLIRNQVRDFCNHYTDDNPDEYFEDASFQFDDRLGTVFGYDEILTADDPASRLDTDHTSDEIEDLVQESVENIESQLKAICRYYYDFIDIYNSIKHGNKFQLSTRPELDLPGDRTYEPDQPFATFLCKLSSDAAEGRPYLSNYPLDRFVNRSLTTADITNTLFSYMDTLVEDRLDENLTQTRRFFHTEETADAEESTESDDPAAGGTMAFWNNDSKTILPQTEELAELVTDPATEIAVRMSIDNDTVYVKTMRDSATSDEYPLIGTISPRIEPGPRLDIGYTASFNFKLTEMDICQYYQALKYDERGENNELNRMVLQFEDTGLEVTEPIGNVDALNVDFDGNRELYENLARAQYIAQTYLPLPPCFLENQVKTISEVIEDNPEREEVVAAIEEAQALGEDAEHTQTLAEIADENRNLKAIDMHPGFIDFDADEMENADLPETLRECFENDDIDMENPFARFRDLSGTYEEFLEDIEEVGLTGLIVENSPEEVDESEVTCSVNVDIEYNAQTFWYNLHRIIVRRAN